MPGPVGDRHPTPEAGTLNAVPTAHLHEQRGVLDGDLEGAHRFSGPKQNGIRVPGSEVQADAAECSGHRSVGGELGGSVAIKCGVRQTCREGR